MQRRIHVPGIDREETHAIDLSLFSPDCRQMAESSLARAVCAPPGIRIDGRVAGNVDHGSATPITGGGGKGTEQGFRQSEWPQQVYGERLLQFLTFRVSKGCEWSRAEARCIVDKNIEPTEVADNLQRHRVDVTLAPDIADDSERTSTIGCQLNGLGGASHKGDASTLFGEQSDECESEAGRPSGDGHAKSFEPGIG